jgi:hypothetical protein
MFRRISWLKGSNHKKVYQMSHLERSLVLTGLLFLLFLSGCSAKPECESIETRSAVLNIVSSDHGNPLIAYAAKNSSANKDDIKNSTLEENKPPGSANMKPMYLLGQKIVTTSISGDKRTLQCSGEISVAVNDIKAAKEINFTVQQSSDGKLSVSVAPFQF